MNPEYLAIIGTILAISGSTISLYGAYVFNIRNDYRRTKYIWSASNLLLLIWCIGFTIGIWNGALAGAALVAMYAIYTVLNILGLRKKNIHYSYAFDEHGNTIARFNYNALKSHDD